jgi:hypothetical protein
LPVVAFDIRAERFVFFPGPYKAKFALLGQHIHGEDFAIFNSEHMGLLTQLVKSFDLVAPATGHEALVALLATLAAEPLTGKGSDDGFRGYLLNI